MFDLAHRRQNSMPPEKGKSSSRKSKSKTSSSTAEMSSAAAAETVSSDNNRPLISPPPANPSAVSPPSLPTPPGTSQLPAPIASSWSPKSPASSAAMFYSSAAALSTVHGVLPFHTWSPPNCHRLPELPDHQTLITLRTPTALSSRGAVTFSKDDHDDDNYHDTIMLSVVRTFTLFSNLSREYFYRGNQISGICNNNMTNNNT